MKTLLITALSFFLFSIIFRLQHWPGGNLMAVLSVFLIFIFAIINSFKKKKIFQINILDGWVIFAWAWYILSRYLFWYAAPSILGFNTTFIIVLALTIIYFVLTINNNEKKLSKAIVVLSTIGIIISFVPSYSIFYFFNLNEVINKEYNKTNYDAWNKYSWFLYIRGEKERALDANQKAIDAWYKYLEQNEDGNPKNPMTIIILNNYREKQLRMKIGLKFIYYYNN